MRRGGVSSDLFKHCPYPRGVRWASRAWKARTIVLAIPLLLSSCGGPRRADYPTQRADLVSSGAVWIPDLGDGRYRNPVLFADYSDPDVISSGRDFYLVASSFSQLPGLPILHSKDLVNWTIIGHVIDRYPVPDFDAPQHGMGVWAPSMRLHEGTLRVYFGDPDRGIYMASAKDASGPWSPLKLIHQAKGWIDPCPFWDDDGRPYLVHAWAKSRAGFNSILAIYPMNREGTAIIGDSVIVFDGHRNHPTVEGPKLYKHGGYYYIFAPAGGVKTGWQTVLRSRSIYGPYEDRIVLHQGATDVNGPHQGAWVHTESGEDWFLHFQDMGPLGRVVHLEPMRWKDDWPLIGRDPEGMGIGEPVATGRKPEVDDVVPLAVPSTSDEFRSEKLGLQWQWEANPDSGWISLDARAGWLRMFALPSPNDAANLWKVGPLLLQKMPGPAFHVSARVDSRALMEGQRAGLLVFGLDYASIALERVDRGYRLTRRECLGADSGAGEKIMTEIPDVPPELVLRISVTPRIASLREPEFLCTFSYSVDDHRFEDMGGVFAARPGKWVGAKVGLFCLDAGATHAGFVDIDWIRFSLSATP